MHRVSIKEKSEAQKTDQNNSDGQIFDLEDGENLFEGLERQGRTLPHGCLSGSCGACCIQVVEGKDNLGKPSLIEANTLEDVQKERESQGAPLNKYPLRLSCRVRVQGPTTIALLPKIPKST